MLWSLTLNSVNLSLLKMAYFIRNFAHTCLNKMPVLKESIGIFLKFHEHSGFMQVYPWISGEHVYLLLYIL